MKTCDHLKGLDSPPDPDQTEQYISCTAPAVTFFTLKNGGHWNRIARCAEHPLTEDRDPRWQEVSADEYLVYEVMKT